MATMRKGILFQGLRAAESTEPINGSGLQAPAGFPREGISYTVAIMPTGDTIVKQREPMADGENRPGREELDFHD